jgi:hypothetical protein
MVQLAAAGDMHRISVWSPSMAFSTWPACEARSWSSIWAFVQALRAEAADLQTAWKCTPRGDAVFLGIDYVDTEPEACSTCPNSTSPIRTGLTSQKIYDASHASGVPETYFIDQDGMPVHQNRPVHFAWRDTNDDSIINQ